MVDNRMIQILKLMLIKFIVFQMEIQQFQLVQLTSSGNLELKIKKKDVFVDGVLDKTKIKVHGKRESIDALYIRRVFYNESHELWDIQPKELMN